ncbi:MAG: PBSX family phage terminase large subunit [Clostridia bacterium]|nr:PBSX family phage terminase large subunit [Clostridia bacterium]
MRTEVFLPDIVGGGYGSFFRCKKRYRVLKGGKGSKKSATTALNYIFRIMKHPESNLLVVRAVFNTHKDSTFAQLKWAQERLKVSHLWQNNLSPLEMTYLPTGQKILFRGFDDVLKLASTTVPKGYLCWVWVEEAYEIKSEEEFDKLDLSMPRGNVGGELFKQTTLTFNPWNREHWLKKRFFDKKSDDVAVFSTNYLINEFLDETDRRVFQRMKNENPRKYAVAGLGEWGVSEGLVYENWCVKEFDKERLMLSPDHKAFFGLDYGYTNDPTAFIAFFADPVRKELFVFDEYYGYRMLNSDIAKMITQKGYHKEKIRADAAEPKSNEDLRRMGIRRITASVKGRDSVINGIWAVQEYKIFVHPSCKNTVSELSAYAFRKDPSGRAFNEPEDENNHLMDALRYAFYDVRFFKPEGENTRINNDMRGIFPSDMKGEWF